MSFNEERDSAPGLRSPQLGALHAVLGYWTTKRRVPATVVMPTGTGKTETMLSLLVAAQVPRLLVIVPSDALRKQISAKFETLGVLQEYGIVAPSAMRPVVGHIEHRFESAAEAVEFAELCNVVVATPQALNANEEAVRRSLLSAFSHLFVDEAHHVAADTWSTVRGAFEDKHVVQFTATPFREDGRHIKGQLIYAYPLREAQAQGYFSRIDYTAVMHLDDLDRAVAEQAVARLRADLAAGFDHVLMARTKTVASAKELIRLYQAMAPEFAPQLVHSQLSTRQQRNALNALLDRTTRVVVCVNMLGEGFDLPQLKVAAIHDPHRSLGVTLQFIGRFARTSSSAALGVASMFVARTELDVDQRLRQLLAEDADWNLILNNLTEEHVERRQGISDFEAGFTSLPEEIAVASLLPKMSTVVYRTPTSEWDPNALTAHFGEENLFTLPIGLNLAAGVAWCVVQDRGPVRWGDVRSIEEVTYQLYVLYFDRVNRLLYVNNSANDGVFEDLVEAVVGPGAELLRGHFVYRVMADIERLIPTNVGVLDTYDHFRRFSMHVGSDVTESFSQAEASTKTQTNISGGGYRDGEPVNISASIKGRIWTYSAANSLKEWCDWCDQVGAKVTDETIDVSAVTSQFILPVPLTERPPGSTLVAVEWSPDYLLQRADSLTLSFDGKAFGSGYVDLIPDTSATEGPLRFTVRSSEWEVGYRYDIGPRGIAYRCDGVDEVQVRQARGQLPLSAWMEEHDMLFILDQDRLVQRGHLIQPRFNVPPFDKDRLSVLDWTGVNIRKESQKKEKSEDSIQRAAIRRIVSDDIGWEVVIDDDGSGEMADVVAVKVRDRELLVRLVHCKYSSGDEPGSRVTDLYEVCGQAQKSAVWRRNRLAPFFQRLYDRAQRKMQRDGVPPFEVGDARTLFAVRDRSRGLAIRMDMVIVQPGLSASAATTPVLELLASTESYLKSTAKASLQVWCSE